MLHKIILSKQRSDFINSPAKSLRVSSMYPLSAANKCKYRHGKCLNYQDEKYRVDFQAKNCGLVLGKKIFVKLTDCSNY